MRNGRTQTDQYRGKLTENRARSREAETQTLAEFRKPIPVRFIPQPSGIDGVTQIENGDLFDFNTEVEPLLEILVSRILEASRREVIEASELHQLRHHQEEFERVRQAEIIEIQRLEAASHRREQEKLRRINQEKANKAIQRIVLSKAMATRVAKDVLGRVHFDALKHMRQSGIFKDPVLVDLEQRIVPEYMQRGIDAYKRDHQSHVTLAKTICTKPVHGSNLSTRISEALQLAKMNADRYNAVRIERETIRKIEKDLIETVVSIFSSEPENAVQSVLSN